MTRFIGAAGCILGLVTLAASCGAEPSSSKFHADDSCLAVGSVASTDGSDCCDPGVTYDSYRLDGLPSLAPASPLTCCTPPGAPAVNANGSDCCNGGEPNAGALAGLGVDVNGNCCANDGSCHPVCASDSDCASLTGFFPDVGYTTCGPPHIGSMLQTGQWICEADDAQPYDGCVGAFTNCSDGYQCWAGSSPSFQICTLTCATDGDCQAQGSAGCCDQSSNLMCANDVESCNGTGACLPCGSF